MEFVSEEELHGIIHEEIPRKEPEEEGDIEAEEDLEDWVEEEEEIRIKSLFNDDILSSVEMLVAHDAELFKFDLKLVVTSVCSDDVGVIKLINFIRAMVADVTVHQDEEVNEAFIIELTKQIVTKEFMQNDVYMKPVIEDDPLLYLYEDTLITFDDDEV